VTGAAGTLGSALVARLADQRHQVRVLLHHRSADFPPGVQAARGDVCNLADLAKALSGIDTVIHAATSPFRQDMATELEGTRAVLAAADRAGAHVVYPSIVGGERLGGTYYRANSRRATSSPPAGPPLAAVPCSSRFPPSARYGHSTPAITSARTALAGTSPGNSGSHAVRGPPPIPRLTPQTGIEREAAATIDRRVRRAGARWPCAGRYLAGFGVRYRAEAAVSRRRGVMRGRNARAWLRSPGMATGMPRSRARRPASTTGPGSASLA
jgi:putative NAD(P)-binding protein